MVQTTADAPPISGAERHCTVAGPARIADGIPDTYTPMPKTSLPLLGLFLLTAAGGVGVPAGAAPAASQPLARLTGVPFTDVVIADRFWAPRRETNRLASIPVNLENLEKAKNLENLRLAGKRATQGFEGPVFMDSDVHKALEAASYSLATNPDPELDRKLDEIIAILAAAQHADGYLNSYYTVKEPGKRWVNLRDNHELYCAGHMFEAAVAHHQATGKTNFLAVARRFADHIDSVFGPPPKRMGYPGHPEIELALVKLARVTGERRYFELAKFFVENRGRQFFAEEHQTPKDRYDGTYWQDDVPICDHRNIKGHAVRAAYLMSGVTDIAAGFGPGASASPLGDTNLLRMLRRVWRNTVERNQYLTGGIGPSAHNEGFTEDYDLPNQSAYQETCATIALAQWAHRLALLYADAQYAEVLERALYNGVLAGVSQDGTRFFYVNPLESRGTHHRSPWFGCACCPPNVARTLASLGGYAYGRSSDGAVYVNLYLQGQARLRKADGTAAVLGVTTDYPWDGRVRLRWESAPASGVSEFCLRIPAWCRGATAQVNGQSVPVTEAALRRGYLVLAREWKAGDEVLLDLPMPVERIAANPGVKADRGAVALQRGPLVYCLEQVDQRDSVTALYLPSDVPLAAAFVPDLLGGVTVIRGTAQVAAETSWNRRLYQAVPAARPTAITAVPYYAWDNRKAGPMRVWLPVSPSVPPAGGLEAQAKVTTSFASGNASLDAIRDGKEPEGSRKHPGQLCHWWPHKGGEEWVQYSWTQPVDVSGASVYWFDDTGVGECRLPASWKLEYQSGDGWKPVVTQAPYSIGLDRWQTLPFEPVTTTALRLTLRQADGWASGIHEWRVMEADE